MSAQCMRQVRRRWSEPPSPIARRDGRYELRECTVRVDVHGPMALRHRGGMVRQVVSALPVGHGADRSRLKPPAAVRAYVLEYLDALTAERAFERTDHRVRCRWWEVDGAVFADRSEFKCHSPIVALRRHVDNDVFPTNRAISPRPRASDALTVERKASDRARDRWVRAHIGRRSRHSEPPGIRQFDRSSTAHDHGAELAFGDSGHRS